MAKIKPTDRARSARADIMRWTGWDARQYKREYDKFRNRVRNYQRIVGGEDRRLSVEKSPAYIFHDFIYRQKFMGGALTGRLSAIMLAPSSSPTARLSARAERNVEEALIVRPFAGLRERSPRLFDSIMSSGMTTSQKYDAITAYAARVRQKKREYSDPEIEFPDAGIYEE